MARTSPKATTFRKRKACITRKIQELCILSDVKACAVIVGPDGGISTWPENHIEVKSVVDRYRNFMIKKKGKLQVEKLEKELRPIIKKKVSMSADWDESWLNEFTTMESLSDFLKAIQVKIQDFKKRSAVLEAKYYGQHEIHEETMQLQPIQAVPDFGGFSYNEGFDSNYEAVMFDGNCFGSYPMPLNYDQGAMNFSYGYSSGLNGSGWNSNEMLEEIKFDCLGENFTNQGFKYGAEIHNLQPDSALLNNGNSTNYNNYFMLTPSLHLASMNLSDGQPGWINDGVILEETKFDYVGNCCINELGLGYSSEMVCLQSDSAPLNNGNSATNRFISMPNLYKESMNFPYGLDLINDGVILEETKFEYVGNCSTNELRFDYSPEMVSSST